MTTVAAAVAAGLLLGARHALDADHLAAVAVLAQEHRSSCRAAWLGALWGVGHTLALALAGVVVLAAHLQFPPALTWWLEFTVAGTLVVLGVRALVSLYRGDTVHWHPHRHGNHWHVHPHCHRAYRAQTHAGQEPHHHGSAHARPFLLGLLHGFAGSASLFLLLLAREANTVLAWVYLLAFGAGSTLSMTAFSAALSVPWHWGGRERSVWHWCLQAATALASIAVGVTLACDLLLA